MTADCDLKIQKVKNQMAETKNTEIEKEKLMAKGEKNETSEFILD